MALFLDRFRRGAPGPAPSPAPVAPGASPADGAPAPPVADWVRPEPRRGELVLPEGWEIAEYAGQGGRALFAVYANGRRMASGMPSLQSAARWARLLATTRA